MRGTNLYGSLPCYTLEKPVQWQQPSIGTYKVLKSQLTEGAKHNLSTRVPFDVNWGRSDYLDILPLSATLQANSDTFAIPNAVQQDSQYAPLAYESWDPMHPISFQRQQIERYQ